MTVTAIPSGLWLRVAGTAPLPLGARLSAKLVAADPATRSTRFAPA